MIFNGSYIDPDCEKQDDEEEEDSDELLRRQEEYQEYLWDLRNDR